MIQARSLLVPLRSKCLTHSFLPALTRHGMVHARFQSTSRTEMPPFPDPLMKPSTLSDSNKSTPTSGSPKAPEVSSEPETEPTEPRKSYLDTMEIFNELRSLGFTEKQSDIILRLVNDNVTVSLDKLNDKILNRSELENELYLFEAAQSELRVEIKTSRETDLRTLQNEKNTLENLLNEEFDELNKLHIVSKNDSAVVINDQFSENTLLQKNLKKRIQELNNKISTEINGDIKSEIEGLRWHTTRSGLMAVLVLVFAIMVGVNVSNKKSKEDVPQQVVLRTIQPEESGEEVDEVQSTEVSLEQLMEQKKK